MMKSIAVALMALVCAYILVSVFFAGLVFNPVEWAGTAKVFGGIGIILSCGLGFVNHIEENA